MLFYRRIHSEQRYTTYAQTNTLYLLEYTLAHTQTHTPHTHTRMNISMHVYIRTHAYTHLYAHATVTHISSEVPPNIAERTATDFAEPLQQAGVTPFDSFCNSVRTYHRCGAL
jgi:hypothetical protein